MQKLLTITVLATTLMILGDSCTGKKEKDSVLTEKKVELEKKKKEKEGLDKNIKDLEAEIAKLDTSAAKNDKAKLVSVTPVSSQGFEHFIDLQGKVEAENTSYITPRGMGGQVRAIFVKEGDNVRKGQLLLKLDDAIARQNVVTIRQSMKAVETQLALAKTVYERQKNLWEQNIGTEVQLLQSKSNMEGLQNQLKTMQESVKLAQEQVSLSNVYSNVSGVAEEVNIHIGETFTGSPMNGIKIVNTGNLKVSVNVPENYITRVKTGTPVTIVMNELNRSYNTTISLVSPSINPSSRSFIAEAKIPYIPGLKPNQIAVAKIRDYSVANAIVIPVNVVQTDEKGKYVYVMETSGDKKVARKKPVAIGELYGDNVEIKNGLRGGEQLITTGYQNIYDGQTITIL